MKVFNYSNNNQAQNQPSFGRFIKIKGPKKEIDKFRSQLLDETDTFLTLKVNKSQDKSVLYLFSKKHLNEFIDHATNMYFREFRTHIEKYMQDKPQLMSLKKSYKEFLGINYKDR